MALARSAVAAEVVQRAGATAVDGDFDRPESLDEAFVVEADCLVNIASLGFGHTESVVAAAEEAGLGAVVVEPEQPRALADALLDLAAHPSRRTEMGVTGLAYVREQFDRAALARRYLSILEGQA